MRVATYFLDDEQEIDIVKDGEKYQAIDSINADGAHDKPFDHFPTYDEVKERFKDNGMLEYLLGPFHINNFKRFEVVENLGSCGADDAIIVAKFDDGYDTLFYAGYIVGDTLTHGTSHEKEVQARKKAKRMDIHRRKFR